MGNIELNIDLELNEFKISGDLTILCKNYRAKSFFKDFLNAVFYDDGITVPFILEEKENTLKKIHDAFQKYGINQVDSNEIKDTLKGYYEEKKNFEIFSKKAKRIWNNEVDVKEFDFFKNVVQKNLTKRKLYDKQFLAAYHLAFSQNACNFSVPGSGKTSIVYGAYTYLKHLPFEDPKNINKILIVGPLSSFGPWEDEFESCFGYKPKSKRLSGGVSKEERDEYLLSVESASQTPELTLMSYQSIPYSLDSVISFLKKKDNHVMVILDEAHKIKNTEGGVWATSILSIAKYAKARIILTGTPVPNGYEDIYNLYEFIWPDREIIRFNTYQLKDLSSNTNDPRIDELINDISPFFIRIKKSDLDLPPIVNVDPIYIEMDETQRQIYEALEEKYLSGAKSESSLISSATIELTKARFIRLMQCATNPSLLEKPLELYFHNQGLDDELYLDDKNIIKKILDYKNLGNTPPKFSKALELVKRILDSGGKVIIWATFIQNIKELSEYLRKNNIHNKILIGEVPVENENLNQWETREGIIREFHDEQSSYKVLIANPFAVAESISLHKACHNAIYLERTFNASNFIQSKDRIHRVGLKKGTLTSYYYILSRNTIDDVIHSKLIDKERRMLEIIESNDIPLFSENMDYDIDLENDFKAVIRDYVRRTTKI